MPRELRKNDPLQPTDRIPRLYASDVVRAIAESHIHMVYQPIVDLQAWQSIGCEALIRSSVPELSSPRALLDAARQQGHVGALGRAARLLASSDLPGLPLFFNIHPDELDDHWLLQPNDPVSSHLAGAYLEISEWVPLARYRFWASTLEELRARGVRLVVDDFGAGYSNVRYLAELQPDLIKLDRELICGMRTGDRMFTLVRALVEMCRSLGAAVVAEGIETETELRAVVEAGVQYGQGYLLGEPGRVPAAKNWSALLTS